MNHEAELSALVRAIEAHDAAAVAGILARRPELARVEVAAEHGHPQTLLHRAVPGDGEPLTPEDVTMVTALLDAGAAVDAVGWGPNHGLCTPLTLAAWSGHAAMVRLLIERGAGPDGAPVQAGSGKRPIDTAAHHGHAEAVEALIEAGAVYSLEHLLAAGLEERLEALLRADPAAAARPVDGRTPPLHLAVTSPNAAAMVELLLAHGAEPEARDERGRTALHRAIEEERQEAVRLLIERGAAVDFFAAAALGETERVAALLAEDPSRARATQVDGLTPLFYAAWAGDAASARRLLAAGAAVSPRVKRLWACLTPLHLALQRRHPDVAAVLLEYGADVDAAAPEPDRYWPTPLHAAARWGTLADVERLLDHGADLNGGEWVPDAFDAGGPGFVISAGNEALLGLMLQRGLDLRHPRHREALHVAAERGHVTVIRLLVEHGADPRGRDSHGQTPRERARASGRAEAGELLEALGG